MGKLQHNVIERYLDGELSSRESKQTEEMLATSVESQRILEENQKLGDFVRMMTEERTRNVSFDGFTDRVLAATRNTSGSPSFVERMHLWMSEFFEHRRVVWIPAAVCGVTAALVLLVLPLSEISPSPKPETENGITLHAATSVSFGSGSKIASVDFGGAEGKTFSLRNERGASVGVVWIEENP